MQPLEAQIRECFGRVVYSHKTHEKCADIYHRRFSRIKFWQIVLSAITTGGLITILVNDTLIGKIVATLCSTGLLALNSYAKQLDLGELSTKHAAVATKLWDVREKFLSLLTDIRAKRLSDDEVAARRDELQRELFSIYQGAPRTLNDAYRLSQVALQVNEELTFSDSEIDNFLPAVMRSGTPGPAR
jgi:hypothetical protein